jgi:hypothetical protein
MSTERNDIIGRNDEAARRGGSLVLVATYEGDEAETARVLLMILGLPAEEIERIVSNLNLDSQSEM